MNSWVIERTVVEHHITVPRTARYHALGDAATASEMWIVLHGYGHLARYFLRKFEGLEEGRLIVAPEGLSRFYLDDGHTRVGATWMTREDRELEIADQLTYLDQLTEHLRAGSRADIRLNVLGFSQGVATACRWAAIGRTAIPRLVLWGGTLPPDIDTNALSTRLSACRVDVVQGTLDTLVPPVPLQGETRWREAGVTFTRHTHPGGHELDNLMLSRLFNA